MAFFLRVLCPASSRNHDRRRDRRRPGLLDDRGPQCRRLARAAAPAAATAAAAVAFTAAALPALILRACESIDFCVFRHESNQGLRTRKNIELRIDSQTLRMRTALFIPR